ncbi:MAG: bifunctional DNA primase/polymerase [Methylobacterium radiotolerans]
MSADDNVKRENIFADLCERYWAAGLPVIPLKRGDKMPAISAWQTYQNQMPSEAERALWSRWHAHGNVGLPLGPQSGLVAIDVDTDDPKVLGILNKVLPPSPWKRIGQKGMVLVYKYDGQPVIRIKYKDAYGKIQTLVEMLGAGAQIVLPPSIHPKTQQPYRANKDLVDCLSDVRSLPANIEQILRDALGQAGLQVGSQAFGAVTDYISTGNRDTRLTSMAGLFARDVIKGEKTLLEACQQIELAVGTFMQ